MMYSTVEDLYRWDRAIAARDERILEDPASWERMFTPGLSDYGYGWVIRETRLEDGGPTVSIIQHGGGIFGFSTAFRRFPDERNTVIVMDNTTENAGAVATAITRVLYDLPVDPPEPSIAERILPVIENAGADAGIQRYHDLKRRSPDEYDFSERELDRLGYYLLGKGQTEAAVKVFRLNVGAYPDAANPYDSLGEALLAVGDTVGAIESYLASLERNPGNENAVAVLEGLDVSVERAMLEGVAVPVEILDRYVGEYEINPGFNLTVRREGTRLFTQATGQAEFEIFATSNTLWFAKAFDAQLEFQVGPNGPAEAVTLHQGGQQRRARRIQ
jgi:tetratricopeptide (TPR) repeat protein